MIENKEINLLLNLTVITSSNMKKLLSVLFLLLTLDVFASSRGLIIKTQENEIIQMPYKESHALLVGVSDYTNGWPDLESIPSELKEVEKSLKKQGFTVDLVLNPKGHELFRSFENFINKYGYHKDNRLLFFYSGHGYTTDNGSKGYLVPADAPNPNLDLQAFKRSAMNMGRLITLSREMESKHALFLFDSCFSGTIFKTRALPKKPPYIERSMSKPVRQFITAGSANEEVPSKSVFIPMFIDAIESKADLNNDGYITGSELGMYLSQSLPNYSTQSPQYGKIKDYELSQGDFIFVPQTIVYKKVPESKIEETFFVNINVDPSDANIMIVGQKEYSYFDGLKLGKGDYKVVVSKEGYKTEEKYISVNSSVNLNFSLQKMQQKIQIQNDEEPIKKKKIFFGF